MFVQISELKIITTGKMRGNEMGFEIFIMMVFMVHNAIYLFFVKE